MKGFTLIELLVVVLIIGILASVALPQYQLAVQKTRTMRLMPLLRAISDAENVYYMANGQYTLDFRDLDVDMPAGAELSVSGGRISAADFTCFLRAGDLNLANSYSAYCNDSRPGKPDLEKYFASSFFICWGGEEPGALNRRVCMSISGKSEPDSSTGSKKTGFSFN